METRIEKAFDFPWTESLR